MEEIKSELSGTDSSLESEDLVGKPMLLTIQEIVVVAGAPEIKNDPRVNPP